MTRLLTIALLLIALPVSAAWDDGNGGGGNFPSVTTRAIPAPTGTINTGDLIVVYVTANADPSAQNDITFSGGTGTWTTSLGNTSWHGGKTKTIILSHIYAQGDTFPTVADGGQTTTYTITSQAFWGVTGIDKIGATATSGSTTVSFPTETPTQSNDEALYYPAIVSASNPTWSLPNPSSLSTCGTTDDLYLDTSVKTVTSGAPFLTLYRANLGPCAVAATGVQTVTSSQSADNLGVIVLLTPSPLAPTTRTPISTGANANALRNAAGNAYYSTLANLSWDSVFNNSWADEVAPYQRWVDAEPTACDDYSWDQTDNLVLNARILGMKVEVAFRGQGFTPCGVTGAPSCTGFTNNNQAPAWMIPSSAGGSGTSSTTCDGSHTMVSGTDFITTIWDKTTFGPPVGSPNILFDPANTAYQAAWDRFITAVGSRYANIKNITLVKTGGIGKDSGEITLNNCQPGQASSCPGQTYACGGTTAQCATMSGYANWASQSYALNTKIFPTLNNTGENYFQVTACSGGCPQSSGTTQPNWDSACATTCPDGSVTWTNEGHYTVTLNDSAQWLALTPVGGGSYSASNSGTCGGGAANQPFVKCDLEPAQKHFEASWHTAFPNAALVNEVLTNASPPGTWTGTDPFDSDIFAYDNTTYPSVMLEKDNALGWNSSNANIFIPSWLPYTSQPQLGIGFEEFSAQNSVGGATCNNGLNSNYSISATNCVPPEVYQALAKMQYPYIEFYPAVWDDTNSQPWVKLVHDLSWGQ